jgi:2-polyprenyl-3-methyl-5-hydroxy-6-metoxy-1,4-benzoquinol methylase
MFGRLSTKPPSPELNYWERGRLARNERVARKSNRRPIDVPSTMSAAQPVLVAEKQLHLLSCGICNGVVTEKYPFGPTPKVVRCVECGTESLCPLPTRAQLKQHYANYDVTNTNEEQVEFLTGLFANSLKFYLKRTNLTDQSLSSLRLLEIGFGNGSALFAAAQMGMDAYGVDLDESNVERAMSYALHRSIPVTLECGDEHSIDGFGLKFDLVKASQVLEHVIDPGEFLSSVAAVQEAGGYLMIECPNNESAFWSLKNALRKKFNRMNFYNSLKLMEHLWGYNKRSLAIVLENAGYRIVFLRDYASGNAIFEPQSVLWYPTIRQGIERSFKHRSPRHLFYPSARILDGLLSSVFSSGTSLAALCQKV